MIYPHKCSRCGFCCVSENCLIAMEYFKIPKTGRLCPALKFAKNENDDIIASCGLLAHLPIEYHSDFGIGQGCCIKGRAYKDGVEYDFAALPETLKRECVRMLITSKKEKGEL
jgi:hypothetical protein